MELASFESLSREEILQILEQRRLSMSDLYNLNYEELLRIYKTFALPLSRRPQRLHSSKQSFQVRQKDRYEQECEDELMSSAVKTNTHENTAMDIDITPQINDEANKKPPLISIGEKRRPSHEDIVENYQYQLSRATKRIKINTTF